MHTEWQEKHCSNSKIKISQLKHSTCHGETCQQWNTLSDRHPFNGLFSTTTWVSRHWKGETSLHFNEARDDRVAVASRAHCQNTLPELKKNWMWVNAQRDGRPAKYRWRPLFNAAVWLTPSTRVPCSNATNTRKPLKFAEVPQTRQQISAVSRPLVHHIMRTSARGIDV